MFRKSFIGGLVICGLTACDNGIDNRRKIEGFHIWYDCVDLDNPASRGLELGVKVRLKTSKEARSFDLAGRSLKNYEIYESLFYYKPDGSGSQSVNMSFQYENDDLTFNVPENENSPACEIRFPKDSNIGEYICGFEKNDLGYQTKTFQKICHAQPKMKHIKFND